MFMIMSLKQAKNDYQEMGSTYLKDFVMLPILESSHFPVGEGNVN